MHNVSLRATGRYVPEKIVTNDDLSTFIETSDEWIASRTGIRERHVAEDETTVDMGIKAARSALEKGGLDPLDIDLIVFATITGDYYTPASACLVQAALGCENAMSFDLGAACSGFVYGMEVCCAMLETGRYQKALVIGAERFSRVLDWSDRTTAVLFGDGAGAVVLEKSNTPKFYGFRSGSDGNKGELIAMPAHSLTNPTREREALPSYITMEGRGVYEFSLKRIPGEIRTIVEEHGFTLDDVDHFILHQANRRMLEKIASRLGQPLDKFFMNMNHYGNTSAASIPIALDEMVENNVIKRGDLVVFSGFGGGLTWSSALIIY